MRPLVIVQLARAGDIIHLLPVARWHADQGVPVRWIVAEPFAHALEGVSYVEPVLWKKNHNAVVDAAQWARQTMPGCDVLVTQVNGNPAPRVCENFCQQQWYNAGLLPRYHDLPLVYDRRDTDAEAAAVAEHLPDDDDRLVIGYATQGHSSPFVKAPQFVDWLNERYGERYRLVDLGRIRLAAIPHMLGILDRCACLVSIDSALMHLSYATRTPMIGLSIGRTWYNSEPRTHWLDRLTYQEAMTPAGQDRIAAILHAGTFIPAGNMVRAMPDKINPARLILTADWYEPADDRTRQRFNRARTTWNRLVSIDGNIVIATHQLRPSQRNSRDDLGDTRQLPYVRDVIEHGLSQARDNDAVVLTNADISIVPEAAKIIRHMLTEHACCYSHRIDVSPWRSLQRINLQGQRVYPGTDLFAFRPEWWERVNHRWPDMLIGCEGWDWVLRQLMRETSPGCVIDPPIVYHERHSPQWASKGFIVDNPGQRHNRRLGRQWAIENGYEGELRPGEYLFK